MMNQKAGLFGQHGLTSTLSGANQASTGFVRYWEIGEYAELQQQLESFLDSALETNQIPYDIRDQWGRQQAVRNPVGATGYRNLTGFLPVCGQWMDLYWPGYAYSADLQLFFDCFQQHPFSQVFGYGASAGICDRTFAARLYNDFIGCLRTEAVRRGVKKWLADWRANLDEQEGAVRRYLDSLLSRYDHLVPIRVDLNYAQCAFDGSDAMPRTGWGVTDSGVWMPVPSRMPVGDGRPETRARIDTAVAMGDRDRFFENRRGADRQLFDRMVGYVCKLEQGGRHGANHFHCVFLIDAKSLTQADVYALKYGLGDRWRRVTRGQGLMFDCHESAYRRTLEARGEWAIDPVDCSNPVQVATFIDYVVRYFTKDDDQMIRVKPTARGRTLTMGR